MRYRIQILRTEVAERVVRAPDEATAIERVRGELEQPHGLVGKWQTDRVEILDVEALPDDRVGASTGLEASGPMLLSMKDAAATLGVSRSAMYELANSGEIEIVRVGRRLLTSRDALQRFVEERSRPAQWG